MRLVINHTIREHRQSLRVAKAAYEAAGGKPVRGETFRTFLKLLATPAKESESGGGGKEEYEHKVMCLGEIERLSKQGLTDLY